MGGTQGHGTPPHCHHLNPCLWQGGTPHPWMPPPKGCRGVLRRTPRYLLAWGERWFWGDAGPLIWGAASTHPRPWVLRPWVRHGPWGGATALPC